MSFWGVVLSTVLGAVGAAAVVGLFAPHRLRKAARAVSNRWREIRWRHIVAPDRAPLTADEQRVLDLFARPSGRVTYLYPDDVTRELGVSHVAAQYLLAQMARRYLVERISSVDGDYYTLTQAGGAYLIERRDLLG
jgi:hypothetical protein